MGTQLILPLHCSGKRYEGAVSPQPLLWLVHQVFAKKLVGAWVGEGILELIGNFYFPRGMVALWGMVTLPAPPASDRGGKIGHLLSLGPWAHTNAISWSPATTVIQAIYSDPC